MDKSTGCPGWRNGKTLGTAPARFWLRGPAPKSYPLDPAAVPTTYPQLGITTPSQGISGGFGPSWREFGTECVTRQVINTVNNLLKSDFILEQARWSCVEPRCLIRTVSVIRCMELTLRRGVVHLTTGLPTGVIHNCGDPEAHYSGIARCGPQIGETDVNYRRVSYQQCG